MIKQWHKLFVDSCRWPMHQRATDAEIEYWFCAEGDDEGISYCLDCIKKLRPNAKAGEDYRGAYPEMESDGCVHCDNCGKLLRYRLTDYGLEEELAYFEESPPDWNRPDDCYQFEEIISAAFTDEQYERVFHVLKRSLNRPRDVKLQWTFRVTRIFGVAVKALWFEDTFDGERQYARCADGSVWMRGWFMGKNYTAWQRYMLPTDEPPTDLPTIK